MQKPPFSLSLLHPKHWPVWLLIGLISAITFLPWRAQLALGKGVGLLLHKVLRSRRHVAEVNIALCFPELSAAEQAALVRQTFIDNSIGFFETMMSWFRRPDWLLPITEFRGLEKIAEAQQAGRGVVLLGAHYSMLDLSGTLICNHIEASITYKRQGHPVLNYIMEAGRARTYKQMFISRDIRGVIKELKEGGIIWYAPDQDFGFKNTIFVPFFNVATATLTATTHLASAGNALVLPMTYFRKEDNSGYLIEIFDALPIPGESPEADAQLANAFLERQIRRYPSQYLWLHKRFKSQPGQEQQRGALYRKKR